MIAALRIDGVTDKTDVNSNSMLPGKLKAAFTVDYVLYHEDAPKTIAKWTPEQFEKIVSQHEKAVALLFNAAQRGCRRDRSSANVTAKPQRSRWKRPTLRLSPGLLRSRSKS